jgi:endogenous inhibitor of DNA gyrase (YacG/DUF329 family)
MADSAAAGPALRPCPMCGKPPVAGHAPFCSARCRQVDLGRWLIGRYVVETEDGPESDERLDDEG